MQLGTLQVLNLMSFEGALEQTPRDLLSQGLELTVDNCGCGVIRALGRASLLTGVKT